MKVIGKRRHGPYAEKPNSRTCLTQGTTNYRTEAGYRDDCTARALGTALFHWEKRCSILLLKQKCITGFTWADTTAKQRHLFKHRAPGTTWGYYRTSQTCIHETVPVLRMSVSNMTYWQHHYSFGRSHEPEVLVDHSISQIWLTKISG